MMITLNPFKILFITLAFNLLLKVNLEAQSIGIKMSIDHWGNVYRWNDTSLEKYDAVQNLFFRNGNLAFGKINKLDLVQPQKPFVFFEDTQRIVFLDNTLSEQGEHLLLQSLLPQSWITQVSGSILGGFWCFDHMNLKIIRIDQYGNIMFTLDNLPQYNALSDWNIQGMTEQKKTLYLWDHEHLFEFDLLGAISRQTAAKDAQYLFDQANVYQLQDEKLKIIFPKEKLLNTSHPDIPFCISQGMIYSWINAIVHVTLE